MRVPASKTRESIEARIQASLNTAQDHVGAVPSDSSGSLGTKLLARQVQERSPSTTSFREVISQLVDSDTADPGWDGEPMDNAFIFARHVHGGRLLLHSNKGDSRGFESQHQLAQGSVTDTRTCLPKASKF